MAGLFPVFDVPTQNISETQKGKEYKAGPLWDYELGDFVTDGSNKALYGSGYDDWKLWCIKSILTQRWAHLAYSTNTGIEADQAFAQPDREAVESAFERTITEALLADPMGRTSQVQDFIFSWDSDTLILECKVIGKDGQTADIKVNLNS